MSARAKPFELRGWHVLAMLLLFFAAIIGVNIAFAVAAVSTFPGEDVQRSYIQGLHYNRTLAERRAQASLGWRAAATFAGEETNGRVIVTLSDRDGAPLQAAQVTGELERPTDARFDRQLQFVQTGTGRYAADVPNLAPGHWRLRARAVSGGQALDFESELQWRP